MPRAPKFIPVAASTLASAPQNLFAGTSGWAYPTWKPGFYPADVPSKGFLHYYASQLTSIEINFTFRTVCSHDQLRGWLEATPPGFRFSFKAPQRISHFQRLRASHDTVAEFIDSLEPARIAGKLGSLLFQLPHNFMADEARLAAFLEAPALAADAGLRVAFEFRHPSWFTEATYAVLRSYNAALCVAESDDLITPEVTTATHRCYRLRRNGGYTPTELGAFAAKFTALASESETYVYFKHEDAPTGPLNATAMLRRASMLNPSPAGGAR